MVARKMVSVTDFLTSEEIKRAMELKTAKLIREQIVEPNIKRINVKLGQENDPMYLSYMIEYILSVRLNQGK